MSTRISSTGLKVVTVGLLAMLASMLGVGTAGAHSAVVGSNPENGASIQVPRTTFPSVSTKPCKRSSRR